MDTFIDMFIRIVEPQYSAQKSTRYKSLQVVHRKLVKKSAYENYTKENLRKKTTQKTCNTVVQLLSFLYEYIWFIFKYEYI